MQSLPKRRLLEWSPNALEDIRKIHNLDKPGRIEEAVCILEEWIQKQDHFLKKDFKLHSLLLSLGETYIQQVIGKDEKRWMGTPVFRLLTTRNDCQRSTNDSQDPQLNVPSEARRSLGKEYLERCLLTSKGSVEKAKKQLDALCTMKTMLPQFFAVHNVKEQIKELHDVWYQFPLPNMTDDFYRIFVYVFNGALMTEKNLMEFFQYNICACEYIKAHDYVNGFILFYDFQKINFGNLLAKMNPVILQQYVNIVVEGFGARLKGIHYLTDSKAVDLLVKMVKQFLSPKISKRIFVHKTIQELNQVIPKHLLPKDYGGQEKSVEELHKEWIEELSSDEHVAYLKMMTKAGTNEKMRHSDKFNDSYMGMPGSFRNLTVD